jgi:LEM3 (ligand-effect modulator 3) family / CDC50 family
LDGFARPPAWTRDLFDLDPDDPENNGVQNEDLMVWMRTAALPTFRKLYRRVNHQEKVDFKMGLPAGRYELKVTYSKVLL